MGQQSFAEVKERYHPRVEANFMVKVMLGNRMVLAKAKDLSMNGLFLCAFPIGKTERLTVSILLPDDCQVVTSCLVKRQHMDGVALEFEQLDWEDLFALARFLHPRLP